MKLYFWLLLVLAALQGSSSLASAPTWAAYISIVIGAVENKQEQVSLEDIIEDDDDVDTDSGAAVGEGPQVEVSWSMPENPFSSIHPSISYSTLLDEMKWIVVVNTEVSKVLFSFRNTDNLPYRVVGLNGRFTQPNQYDQPIQNVPIPYTWHLSGQYWWCTCLGWLDFAFQLLRISDARRGNDDFVQVPIGLSRWWSWICRWYWVCRWGINNTCTGVLMIWSCDWMCRRKTRVTRLSHCVQTWLLQNPSSVQLIFKCRHV